MQILSYSLWDFNHLYLDFLSARIGISNSSTITLNTGTLQVCVLSLLLFTLLTYNCAAKYSSNHINKFADGQEWCRDNNLLMQIEV